MLSLYICLGRAFFSSLDWRNTAIEMHDKYPDTMVAILKATLHDLADVRGHQQRPASLTRCYLKSFAQHGGCVNQTTVSHVYGRPRFSALLKKDASRSAESIKMG
jgi:hypothetical protein